MNRLLILASLLLVASSCSKDLTAALEEPSAENSISLSAQLPNSETRLGSNTENNDSWTFSWEQYDALGDWSTGCTSLEKFTNTAATGVATANFSGDLGAGENHRFIYPYEDITITEGSTLYPIDISSQDGSLNKTYFITQELYALTDLKDGTVTTLAMEHVGGFMAVDIYLENYNSDFTYTLKKVEYVGIPTEATIDLEEDFDSAGLIAVTATGSVIVEVSEEFAEVTDNEVKYLQAIAKLNIIPFELKDGDKLTVNLTVEITKTATTESTDEIISSITFTNSGDQSFSRATHNFTNLLADASQTITISSATINGWNTENEGELDATPYEPIDIETDSDGVYYIYTAAGLTEFAAIVNGSSTTTTQNQSAKGVLMNDINLEGDADNQWTPIGYNTSNPYKGIFNGGGFEVSGLYIDDNTANYKGLFGYALSAEIKNVSVSGKVTGNNYVGGVVGDLYSSTIESCYNNEADVSGTNYVGGVVGDLYSSTIESCYNNEADVSGTNYVGGVVGRSCDSTMESCYNKGAVTASGSSAYVGGVVGYSYAYTKTAKVENCYNTGAITATGTSTPRIGGVVGYVTGYLFENDVSGSSYQYDSYVTACYSSGQVSSAKNKYFGGVIGETGYYTTITYCCYDTSTVDDASANDDSAYSPLTAVGSSSATGLADDTENVVMGLETYEMTTSSTLLGYLQASDSTAWIADTADINNGYPILSWEQTND